MIAASSVPLPAPEVPVTTTTGYCSSLAVEETNQLGPLAIGETADRLRLADSTRIQEPRRLHPSELRDRHQHVEHFCGRNVLRRIAADRVDGPATLVQTIS